MINGGTDFNIIISYLLPPRLDPEEERLPLLLDLDGALYERLLPPEDLEGEL
jgi:hypothetical protein